MTESTVYNFHDLPLWDRDAGEVYKAFTAYVLQGLVGRASDTQFFTVTVPFGAQQVSCACVMGAPTGEVLEFLIITSDAGEPMAMASRVLDRHGQVDEDSLGFVRYRMEAYNQPGVLDLLRTLPRMLLPDAACTCDEVRH